MATLTPQSIDPAKLHADDLRPLPAGDHWAFHVSHGKTSRHTFAYVVRSTEELRYPPRRWWHALLTPAPRRVTHDERIATGIAPGVGRASALAAMDRALRNAAGSARGLVDAGLRARRDQ